MSLEHDLQQIGLDEKEAKVYLAALELGPATIQNLTKKSGINRSTVYEMIKNLKRQGLVSETIHGKKRLVLASEPENIKKSIKARERVLNDILPDLKSLSNLSSFKPKIVFYESKEGLQEIYNDTLNIKEKEIWAISPSRSIIETVGEDFLNKYIVERARKEIHTKLIHITSNTEKYKYLEPDSYESTVREVRFTPKEIDLDNVIVIYENKVAALSTRKEGFGFVVESKDYAKTMKVFYNLLWEISSPHTKNIEKQKTQFATEEDIYY